MYPWLTHYWQLWLEEFNQGRLAHAWLISGASGMGKGALAEQMAAHVLCQHPGPSGPCGLCHGCQLMTHGNHPDLLRLGHQGERSIGIDAVRELIARVSGSAQLSGYKVVLLARAEIMTEAAANALLKTLEEPPGRTLFVLQSAESARLLPTILSRCQKLLLAMPPASAVLGWLQQQPGGANATEQQLRLNQYAPLRTLEYLASGLDEKRRKLLESVAAVQSQPAMVAKLAEQILASQPDSLKWLGSLLLDALKAQCGCPATEWAMADAPHVVRQLATRSTAALLEANQALQALLVPEAMPSSMPSLQFIQWCHHYLVEENSLAR